MPVVSKPPETQSLRSGAESVPTVETVPEAQREYQRRGEAMIHPGYRTLIESLLKSGFEGPIPNKSYLDALFLTEFMFNQVERSFMMLSGAGADGFLSTLRDPFEEMLSRLAVSGGEARVIVLSESLPTCLQEMELRHGNILKFVLARALSGPIAHFFVCDSRMVRREDIHEPISDDTPITAITATVYLNNKVEAKRAEDLFTALWNRLHPMRV